MLEVKRDGRKVVEFVPNEDIEFIAGTENQRGIKVFPTVNSLIVDEYLKAYTFKVPINHNPSSETSPKYSNVFTLPVDVHFEKGVEYLISGWLLNDGSINFSFMPTNTIFRSDNRSTSEEEDRIISKFPLGRFLDDIDTLTPDRQIDENKPSENDDFPNPF